MINATQIRKGMFIRLQKNLFRVEEMEHITPGKGNAVVQTKIRDLNDMTVRNHRFRSNEKVETVSLDTRELTFSYADGDHFIFMDSATYDQVTLDKKFLSGIIFFLKENETYLLESIQGKPVAIVPPQTMDFLVIETEKYMRGSMVQASFKPARLDNGMEVSVPPFVEPGNIIRLDTRSSSYLERISK